MKKTKNPKRNEHERSAYSCLYSTDHYLLLLPVLVLCTVYQCDQIKRCTEKMVSQRSLVDFLSKSWKSLLAGTLPVWNGMFNSIFIATCSAVLCTYFSTMTAYAIHAYDFKGKKFMFTFILAVMMIPTQVTALGFLQLLGKMHLDDSFIPLIVPSIAAPVTFFYMKQYMESNLPLELVEAARIDGSGEFKTFNRIVFPLMKPAIAVQAIFTFVQSWNNYFIPALVLHSDKKKTLPVLIAQLRSADFLKFDMGQVYVMIAFSIFPVIIVYILLSKFIVEGVSAGAVKG